MRCEDHAIWVPAHEFGKPTESAEQLRGLLHHEPSGGWYVFCGREGHIPRGVPTRYGPNKEGGRLVRKLFDHEKRAGLELFEMWETGVIEDGFEKIWDESHFTPSCTHAPTMTIIANALGKGVVTVQSLHKMYSTAFEALANRKATFFAAPWDEFLMAVGEQPKMTDVQKYTCSRCAIVICMNRLSPFFDGKKFKQIIKSPEILET
jgi:hypothetical protein